MVSQEIINLYKTYCGKDRHYHNINHIFDLFVEFNECSELVENKIAMRFAIWYHDYVYDPTQIDNEERSSDVAFDAVLKATYPLEIAKATKRLVLVTKHAVYYPETNDEKLICDLDLIPLASDKFEANTKLIRLEYAHVPDDLFIQGRKMILKSFLEKPTIYYTEYFQKKYEEKARHNLIIATY